MAEGVIIEFPSVDKRRICDNCEHAAFSVSGIFCLEYREEIWNPAVAQECESFESTLRYPARIRK